MQPPAEPPPDPSHAVAHAASPNPEVILVGASVRAAAESARRAGFSVTGVDCFGDVDTRRACQRYVRLATDAPPAELAGRLPAAAAVVVVGGLGGGANLLRLLRKRHPIFGAPQREPVTPLQLSQLARICERSGVGMPPTVPAGRRPRDRDRRRWLEKDLDSSGGLGVRWARAAGDGAAGDGAAGDGASVRAWHQLWIAGRAFGAVFLGLGGSAALLGVCRSRFTRRPGRPFLYAGSSGPAPCSDRVESALIRFGNAYAADRVVTGLFNVDFILDRDERIWVVEINRRWSASCEVVEQTLRYGGQLPPPQTLFGWHWQAIAATSRPPGPLREVVGSGRSMVGDAGDRLRVWKRIVYGRRNGRFDPEQLGRAGPGAAGLRFRITDVPQPMTPVRQGEPLLTLIGRESAKTPVSWRAKRALIATAQRAVVPESDGHA